MPKLIGLFRRKEGTTHAEFRDYYETRHAPLAASLFGDLFTAYRRNYVDHDDAHLDPTRRHTHDFDVVTEIVFATRADLDRMFARSAEDASVRETIATDEAAFMDPAATRLLIVTDHRESPAP